MKKTTALLGALFLFTGLKAQVKPQEKKLNDSLVSADKNWPTEKKFPAKKEMIIIDSMKIKELPTTKKIPAKKGLVVIDSIKIKELPPTKKLPAKKEMITTDLP